METSMNKEAFKLGQRRIGNRYGFLSDVTDDFFFFTPDRSYKTWRRYSQEAKADALKEPQS